ncbi:MAG: hypothetical protein RPR40_05635 [Bermanella sp.]
MRRIAHSILLSLLLALSVVSYAADNPLKVSHQAQATLHNLNQWENRLLRTYLQHRISENQHLIGFINESRVEAVKTEHDASYNQYVASLLNDQQSLARLSKALLAHGRAENLDFDSMLGNWPVFHHHLKHNLNKTLTAEQGDRLLKRVLYFSLQDKYAQR